MTWCEHEQGGRVGRGAAQLKAKCIRPWSNPGRQLNLDVRVRYRSPLREYAPGPLGAVEQQDRIHAPQPPMLMGKLQQILTPARPPMSFRTSVNTATGIEPASCARSVAALLVPVLKHLLNGKHRKCDPVARDRWAWHHSPQRPELSALSAAEIPVSIPIDASMDRVKGALDSCHYAP